MDAFIYDHVRTPRGKGKSDGKLHEVTAVNLASQTLATLRDRSSLDTRWVEDVVLGCVAPVGEQGSNIARIAVMMLFDIVRAFAGVRAGPPAPADCTLARR